MTKCAGIGELGEQLGRTDQHFSRFEYLELNIADLSYFEF